MSLRLLLPSLLILALACSHANSLRTSERDFELHAGVEVISARVAADRTEGPAVLLKREETGLRGYAFGQSVDLTWTQDKVTGFVGTGPVEFVISRDGDGWRGRGLFHGVLSDLQIDNKRIEGRAGRCSYSLRAQGPAYFEGFRSCGRSPVPTSMLIPNELLRRSQPELLASLALFMSR